MTIAEAKATIYANVVYACEKAGFAPQTTRLVQDACDTIIALADRKTEPMKTGDYCDICKQDMCEVCVSDAANPYCVPSHYEIRYEPKTEPEVRSNLEPFRVDEPQTDCAWK